MQFSISVSGTPAEIARRSSSRRRRRGVMMPTRRRSPPRSPTTIGRKLADVGVDETITHAVVLLARRSAASDAAMQSLADRKTARQSNPLAPAPMIPSPHADVVAPEGARTVQRIDGAPMVRDGDGLIQGDTVPSSPPNPGAAPARRASDQSPTK
jgi:hypothetical protein